jgi:trigger factor
VNIQIKESSPTRRTVTVTVPAAQAAEGRKEVARQFAKQARLPGFRPGKAPEAMVSARFAKDIDAESRQRLLSEGYEKLRADDKLEIFALVSADQSGEAGADVTLTFEVDVVPPYTLPDWRSIKVEVPVEAVTDADVTARIDEVRSQKASFAVSEAPAGKGDYVRLAYAGTVDGKDLAELAPEAGILAKSEGAWEEAGAEGDLALIPAVAKALVGLKAGDTASVDHTFAADHAQEALRGKTARYAVTVSEVRSRRLPELDEAFAKSVGVDTLDQLREQVRKGLEGQRKAQAENKRREQALDLLLKPLEFPLPESAVERESYDLFMEYANLRMRGGASPESLEKDREQILADARKAAGARVRSQIVLSRIAREEKLSLTQEELGAAVMRAAYASRTPPEKLAKDRDQLRQIQRDALLNKALDHVLAGGQPAKQG